MGAEGITEPVQKRSRDSYARVRAAAIELMSTRGVDGVTISEISARAEVAVGTIYGRVGSRANLLRVVHQEELSRIASQLELALDAVVAGPDGLESVRAVLTVFVREMHENAVVIKTLIALGQTDEALRAQGRESWDETRTMVITALRRALVDGDAVPDATMDWLFEVVYALTARRFDIGDAHPQAPRNDEPLAALVDRMAHTVMALLAYNRDAVRPGGGAS